MRPSSSPGLSWHPREEAGGCVLYSSRALTEVPPLAFEASSEPLPCPYLFEPIAVAVSLGCCLWDLLSPPWGVLRNLKGHLGWAPGSFSDDR